MKFIKPMALIILLVSIISCSPSNNRDEKEITEVIVEEPVELSLYDRLGGEQGISSIVDDIITKHLANPIVSPQFAYLANDPAKMKQVKKHTCDFLGAGTGGSEVYTGADVPTVHRGMNITNEEYLAVVDDILFVLNDHNVSDQTKKDMLYILYSFKGQVIGL
jgi:hemoglobin